MVDSIKTHRSVRNFIEGRAIPEPLMRQLIAAATRASTTGGMQLYSIVVSESEDLKERLSPLHFNQPMVKRCSAVVTFCADVARFSRWCELGDAQPGYNNFAWYVNAAIDTLLAAQNFCLEAQSEGLGICYLGTTIYTTQKLIETLELPYGVIPITTVAVGYPDSSIPTKLAPRLPLEAVWHRERYCVASDQEIMDYWRDVEESEQTQQILMDNDLPTLQRVFTERRYKTSDNIAISKSYFEVLGQQGFLEHEQV